MANTISYAELYQDILDQKYTEVGKASDLLEPLNTTGRTARTGLKWMGGKTVQIPKLTITGLIDHDRNGQSTVGDIDSQYETKTMEHDRSKKLAIDPEDIEESGEAVAIANVSRVFTEEQVIPEIDTRIFSKIYEDFQTFGGTDDTTVLSTANILTVFDTAMQQLDDAEAPQDGRILYVTSATNNLLKNADQLTREIQTTTNMGDINRIISVLDNVKRIVVPSGRLATAYDYTEGFTPDIGSFQMNLILLHPTAVTAPLKVDGALLDPPSATNGGVNLWFYRLYMDAFLFENKVNGVFINRGTTPLA